MTLAGSLNPALHYRPRWTDLHEDIRSLARANAQAQSQKAH
jgi:hypothetical protein